MAYQFSEPYWYTKEMYESSNTFRKDYIYPKENDRYPLGCVMVFCEDVKVAELPWTWCVYNTRGIVERLWPNLVEESYFREK
jgi:hypothetical protein